MNELQTVNGLCISNNTKIYLPDIEELDTVITFRAVFENKL